MRSLYNFSCRLKSLEICSKSDDRLFGTPCGFWPRKENCKGDSSCCEDNDYFYYHGLSNVYLSNSSGGYYENFTPKRIIVIQMN